MGCGLDIQNGHNLQTRLEKGQNSENMPTLLGETLSGEIFVGRNYSSGEIFVTKRKIRHFRPTKSFAQ